MRTIKRYRNMRKEKGRIEMKGFWTMLLSLSLLLTTMLTSGYGKLAAAANEPIQEGSHAIVADSYRFNFASQTKPGYQSVVYDTHIGAPLYNASVGYGFVEHTSALPPREVHTDTITSDGTGFFITEPEFYAEPKFEKDNYNNYGMTFRIAAPPGAYNVYVRTTSDTADTAISISGMQASRLLSGGHWDAAKLVPKQFKAEARGKDWTFAYVNGREYLDIEIEPNRVGTKVGIEEIVLEPVAAQERASGDLPTIFTLGDSTVKSYTFDEAPMSGWGQVFDTMFDPSKVRVINYSMGGRSFKNAYAEGRLNDILLSGRIGDHVLIQFGHNDESMDEFRRYGRGSTEAMYETYIKEVYLPAIRARGMVPVLITPVSRIKGDAAQDYVYSNSFTNRKFPDILKRIAAEESITLIDLNTESVQYYNEIGVKATTAIFMSIEAGETPGKTNDGSYANGHPSKKIDGTHYKEALSKQLARMVVTDLVKQAQAGHSVAADISSHLKDHVKLAVTTADWTDIFPEMAKDTTTGEGAYYRNQIEKLLQLGVMNKDHQGNFNPRAMISVEEFADSLTRLMNVNPSVLAGYSNGELSRELMGAMLYDAYQSRFIDKPRFMTDFNGSTVVPGDPDYDPNLDSGARGAMYYPLVSWQQLTDTENTQPHLLAKLKGAYDLGLIRSEKGIARGQMTNGTELEPRLGVTREQAAKALYFMWVLRQDVTAENDTSSLIP